MLLVVLKLNSEKLLFYLNNADQNHLITIFNGTGEPKEFIKKNIDYSMDNDLNALIIIDKLNNTLHILFIKDIRQITLEGFKFKPISWFDGAKEGGNKIEV